MSSPRPVPRSLQHQAGDRVWGTVHPLKRHTVAGAAEYVVVTADRIGPAPADLASVEAASLVVAGTTALTALTALRDTLHLKAGERAGYVTSGGLKPVIDSVYPLAGIASAHQAFERGGVVGKQVVEVRGSS
ncbi:zinc-binding dehydrogenase [Streptomyces sp. NPDC058773]|uniref:zinc-binding dehydrogenase n=1 Tax=Streptomyces sp. NPDC058773 TaxID=3346632 RepID=UPI0036A79742